MANAEALSIDCNRDREVVQRGRCLSYTRMRWCLEEFFGVESKFNTHIGGDGFLKTNRCIIPTASLPR